VCKFVPSIVINKQESFKIALMHYFMHFRLLTSAGQKSFLALAFSNLNIFLLWIKIPKSNKICSMSCSLLKISF
jgi:hypothetical protein